MLYYLPTNLFAQDEKITNEQIYRELKIFEAKTEERFKSAEQRSSDLFTFLWILTGIFAAISGVSISLAFWDRKTIIETSVIRSKNKIETEGLTKKILDALRELAKEDKKVANILKNFNLL
jgi:hypothetical protein